MTIIAYAIVFCAFGYGLGWAVHEGYSYKLYRDQQRRGDYWFDRYQQVVRDDWEPIGSDDE